MLRLRLVWCKIGIYNNPSECCGLLLNIKRSLLLKVRKARKCWNEKLYLQYVQVQGQQQDCESGFMSSGRQVPLAAGQQVRHKVRGRAVVRDQLQELSGARLHGDHHQRLCRTQTTLNSSCNFVSRFGTKSRITLFWIYLFIHLVFFSQFKCLYLLLIRLISLSTFFFCFKFCVVKHSVNSVSTALYKWFMILCLIIKLYYSTSCGTALYC